MTSLNGSFQGPIPKEPEILARTHPLNKPPKAPDKTSPGLEAGISGVLLIMCVHLNPGSPCPAQLGPAE